MGTLAGLFRKKKWRMPKQANVLIYGVGRNLAFDTEFSAILSSYSFEVLPIIDFEINIPVLFFSLFKKGKLKNVYYDEYIRIVSPRLVITYLDNNVDFYSLSIRNKKIKTLFVQNGTRAYFADVFELLDKKISTENLHVDFMLTFGSVVGKEYSRYISGEVIPIGSFRNNGVPVRNKSIKNSLCFVSQYRDSSGFDMGGIFYSFEEFWVKSERLIIRFLVEYAKTKGKDFYIIPALGHHKNIELLKKEKDYYNQLAGRKCKFTSWEWHGSSYDAIDSTEVTVAIDSSMGLEALARGSKAAIFSIRSNVLSLLDPPFLNFGWPAQFPDDGPFWTNRPDERAFEKILDYLFSVDIATLHSELIKNNFSSVLEFDAGNTILKKILKKELQFFA